MLPPARTTDVHGFHSTGSLAVRIGKVLAKPRGDHSATSNLLVKGNEVAGSESAEMCCVAY